MVQWLQKGQRGWGGLVYRRLGTECTGPRGCGGGLLGWGVPVFSLLHGAQGPPNSSPPGYPESATTDWLPCLLLRA